MKSPTYFLIEPYELPRWTVYHFDLYHLVNAEGLEFIGIRDYFNDTALCLVEWPQRGKGILPAADIALTLRYQGDGRQAELQALSDTGARILAQLSPRDWDTEVKGSDGIGFVVDRGIVHGYGARRY